MRKSVFLLCLLVFCGLCLCGCGSVTTADAQSYLDGSNDVSETEEKTASPTVTKDNSKASPDTNNSADMSNTQSASPSPKSNTPDSSSGKNSSTPASSSSKGVNSGSAQGTGGNSATAGTTVGSNHCTVSIDCKTILNNMSLLNAAKTALVPADGVILKTVTVTFQDGDSVFDVLKAVTKANGIHMDFNESPSYGGAYVKGIANLYERDCGDLSGWEFNVNGWYPNYACSNYTVSNGDAIEWRYTCNVGKDL